MDQNINNVLPDYDRVSIKRLKGIKQERIMSVLKKRSMIFLSWDNLSRILSGGVGVGSRVKAPKRLPSPKSSRQGSGQVLNRRRGLFNVLKALLSRYIRSAV